MPQVLEHIDAISHAKMRDVLYIEFHQGLRDQVDWQSLPLREQIITWMDAHAIVWTSCVYARSNQMMTSCKGQMYIDLPLNEADPRHKNLCDYLENPDGTRAFTGAPFRYYPLSTAMKNAHHDAPSFLEKWPEEF